jgi:phage I-like protein
MPKIVQLSPRPNLCRRAIDLPQTAPTRFIIFNAGDNPGDDGPAIFDDVAAKLVMSEFKKRGVVRLTIDYDHASIKSDSRPQDRIAAGWFTPGLANGDCLAENVNWTDSAKKGIEDKEWLYISPVFTKDDDGRITSIVNLAITNNPATWGARPLIAASRGFSMDPNLAMLYACLLAVAGGADQAFATWANDNAAALLSMAGDNAAAIQEAAKQYMVTDPTVAASAATEEKPPVVAASTTVDDTKVAASTTSDNPDEQAARSLNPVSAAMLARSQMAADTTASTVTRSAEIEKMQKDKLLPKDGPTVVYARSCDDKSFADFATNLRATNAVIRTAGVKLPVGGKNVLKTNVPVEIDPLVLRTAVRQSGIAPEKIQAQILRNREKQAAKENK